jgi:MFS family permease
MRRRIKKAASRTFSSLNVRNYRLYFIGQAISLTGTWMQSIGQSWLVLHLTGSGTALGLVAALQFLPILVLAPYGGIVAGRFSKRRLLFFTQAASLVLALTLGLLVATDSIRLWMVYVLAAALGIVNSIDNPTRQSFVHELVGPNALRNAVSLNSTEVNLSRVVGPAVAGIIIATVGLAWCFIVNAVSFVAVLACLLMMRGGELHLGRPLPRQKGQLREGFDYVLRTPLIRDVLLMMAIVGTLTYEFGVTLPLLARFAFHGGAPMLAWLTSAMGVGAAIGGLATAGRRDADIREFTRAAFAFGVATALVGVAPSPATAVLAMLFVGAASVRFTALCNTILQLASEPRMRSRVMALWSVAFLGSTFIGGPAVGWIGEHLGVRWSLGVGGLAALGAGLVGLASARATVPATQPAPAEESA